VTIRPRLPEDLPSCVAVLVEVHQVNRYPEVWQSDPTGWLDSPGTIAAWVAESAGQITGHVSLTGDSAAPDAASPSANRIVRLSRLFVAPTAQGGGVARRLMTTALSWAEDQRLDVILEVDQDTPAVAVYERLGWRYLSSGPGSWIGVNGRQPIVRYYAAPGK
jgi:GNAT superfamily N-acetyltransferase